MNDPRVTDYALGELDPAAREAFERDLATSTALQQELQETIALLEALPTAITMNETLTDSARKTLRESASDNLRSRRQNRAARRYVISGAVAASLAIGATALFITRPAKEFVSEERHTALTANSQLKKESSPATSAPAEPASLAISKSAPSSVQIASARPADQPVFSRETTAAAPKFDGHVDYGSPIYTGKDLADASSVATTSTQLAEAVTRRDIAGGAKTSSEDRTTSGAAIPVDEIAAAPAGAADSEEIAKLPSASSPESPAPASAALSAASRLVAGNAGVPVAGQASGGMSKVASLRSSNLAPNDDFTMTGVRESIFTRRPTSRIGDSSVNTEAYDSIKANAFLDAQGNPLSTFSIDVDTASYANVRRFLNDGQLPPAGAVRLEELINYFPYRYPQPDGDVPFSVTTDVTRAPWNEEHLLARIALKGREVATDNLPASNLVFLIDVSGSMDEPDKLPLLKRSLSALVEKLSARDHVAIVVYAGASGLALPSTSGEDKARILEAIDRLEPGGSTNGASGIRLAYGTAREHFLKEGNNRVILCTDGDFNVGVTNRSDLVDLIEGERKSGVFLSVLGFGTGNVKDSQMEQLADKGNGNYAYIDSPAEGRKVLVEQMGATLFTIAKDVKIQVEFNPATVAGYRLIGYENRLLAKEDFNDDKKDAGEIGAGHTVTALYEIVPVGQSLPHSVDPLKYQTADKPATADTPRNESDLFTVKLRYKAPDSDKSKLLEQVVKADSTVKFDQAPEDLRFASAVAAFGMKLRADATDSDLDWNTIQKIARESLGEDPGTYRAEFLTLVQKARQIAPEETRSKDTE